MAVPGIFYSPVKHGVEPDRSERTAKAKQVAHQAQRDAAERARVATINWAIENAKVLPMHGLPRCLRSFKKVEFIEHDIYGDRWVTSSVGSNIERMEELLHSTGFVDGHVYDRQDGVRELAKDWSGTDHEQFIAWATGVDADVSPKKAEWPFAVNSTAQPEATVVETPDDGVSLDEALSFAGNGSAGTW